MRGRAPWLAAAFLALACGPAWALGQAEDGVVDVELPSTPTPSLTPSAQPSPRPTATPTPSNAVLELAKARATENLEEALDAYRRANETDPQGAAGAEAALESGKLQYQLGRYESAMLTLDKVPEAALQGEPKAQLLYWRAQSRLVLKGVSRAQDDFEAFLKLYPGHALADAARLGVADCDAMQGHSEAALKGYHELAFEPPSSVAPQALLQAATLQARLGKPAEARALWERLASGYPEALEAGKAREALKVGGPVAVSTPVQKPAAKIYTVQVGAYVRRVGALALVNKLKNKRYPVRLDKRVLSGGVFHIVQVGRYKDKASAEKAAQRLKSRERGLISSTSIVEVNQP